MPGISRFLFSGESERLDLFLAAAGGFSRRGIRKLIADGMVAKNGRITRMQSKLLDNGDVIDLLMPPEEIPSAPAPPPPAAIIHEDAHLVAVDKPAGLLSQPIRNNERDGEDSMDRRLLLHLAWRDGKKPFLRMLHRLDRPTSGLMLFARTPQVLRDMDARWRAGAVERSYLAVLTGSPPRDEYELDYPIARDRSAQWRFACHPGGKPARTHIRILHRAPEFSIALCELISGRTHQVRVHCSTEGFPVIDDALYGGPRREGPGILLHAWGMSFSHPKTHKDLRLHAEIPRRFETYLPPGFPRSPHIEDREVPDA